MWPAALRPDSLCVSLEVDQMKAGGVVCTAVMAEWAPGQLYKLRARYEEGTSPPCRR